jgi:hypothetical protein
VNLAKTLSGETIIWRMVFSVLEEYLYFLQLDVMALKGADVQYNQAWASCNESVERPSEYVARIGIQSQYPYTAFQARHNRREIGVQTKLEPEVRWATKSMAQASSGRVPVVLIE